MFFRSLARASTLLSACSGALLAALAPAAHAGPPVITGNAATVQVPDINDPAVVINLRELGVIAGSAPLVIDPSTLNILVNGQTVGGLTVAPFPNNGPGHVCIGIFNQDFTVGTGQAFSLQLVLTNLAGTPRVGPAIIAITNTPGPVVDTPAEQAACDDRNTPPVANAGPDQNVNDTDGQAGESVTLDGSATTDVDVGNVLTYQWFDLTTDSTLGPASTSPTLTVTLAPGPHNIQLSVTDDSSDTSTSFASDDVVVTINGPIPPTANAGPNQTLDDTDGQIGETVTLDGSASTDPDGTIVEYDWIRVVDADTIEQLGTGPTITVRLPDDGNHDIRLQVTDNAGNSSNDSVVITVNSPARPTANAGPDRNVADSDGQPGESVTLDASASTDPDGAIATYEWSRLTGGQTTEVLGTGVTLTVTLPDGRNDIILEVTDTSGNVSTDFQVITVAEPPPATILSEIPGLTPNQRRMANKLDGMCDALAELSRSESALSDDQVDLLTKCNGIRVNNTTANQIEAIEELIPDDFSVARTQTLLFANTQYASIMDRLMALRGGARGLSLAGLNVIVDGKLVPLAQLEEMAKEFLGGGASADEPGGLLSDKWGIWFRGNFSFGEKDQNASSPAFDADQWAFVGGLDYRLSDKAVLGAALSYGSSSVDFAADDGALDTDSFALSLYGSAYAAKNFYFDGIVNLSNSSYDASRNITYVDGIGLVTADAQGDTDGMTWSGGLSMGYDFLAGGLTISPNLGVFYIDTTIDGFTETGAGGLNLIYDEQKFESFTGNVGLRLTYAWNLSWGVLLPHLRVDYVREFEDDVDVFGVRFANDPNAAATPPVLVETDNPDTSYWRLAGGFSAQFKHGISGYIEYQRLESFEFISFQDVSIGLRFQRSF